MRNLRGIVRFVMLLAATLGVYGFWFLLKIFVPNKQYWRQLTLENWAKSFVWICGMQIEVIGSPPKPPFFLVSNHVGYIDIPAVRAKAKGIFVAKHDISDWFMAGKMIRNMGTIFVNREKRRDIPRAGVEVIEALSRGEGVIVFPEGTSTKGDEVLPFNSSFLEFAARTDTPVSYVSVSYRTPDGEPPPSESICWWDDTPFLNHMVRLLSVKRFTAILNFGDEPVISPDRKQLASELHHKVLERFIPMI